MSSVIFDLHPRTHSGYFRPGFSSSAQVCVECALYFHAAGPIMHQIPRERVKCTLRSDLSLPAQGTSVKTATQRERDRQGERARQRNQEMMLMPRGGSAAVTHECLPNDGINQLSTWCRPFPWPRVTATLAAA